jgi:hypothetical protein
MSIIIVYNVYYSQLQQAEEAREAEMTDVNELTAEFTQRLTDAEMRVSSAIKVCRFHIYSES